MKKRLLGALALAAALLVSAVAASAGSSSPDRQTATKVVIWLQNDADSGWKQMVTSTNDAFKAKHRDVDVDVQYQWGDHLTKFDAALAGAPLPTSSSSGTRRRPATWRVVCFRTDDTDKELPELQDVAEGAEGLVYLQRAPLLRAVLRGARAVIYRRTSTRPQASSRRRRASPSSRPRARS